MSIWDDLQSHKQNIADTLGQASSSFNVPSFSSFTNELTQDATQKMLSDNPELRNMAAAMGKSPEELGRESVVAKANARDKAHVAGIFSRDHSSGGSANTGTNTTDTTSGSSAVDALSAARAPRTTTFGNIFGSTGWDPDTGQFIQETSPEAAGMASGLWDQMQGVQQQLSDFDVGSAADVYLQAVMQPLEAQRAQQDQTTLSRMIASGKLGASGSARAMAEQETQRGLQDIQTSAMARQQALGEQQNLFAQQQALQGLLTGVAGQQFAGQQAALGAIPLGQEIMSFSQEPQFQYQLAQDQIAAQAAANRASTGASMWSALLGAILG